MFRQFPNLDARICYSPEPVAGVADKIAGLPDNKEDTIDFLKDDEDEKPEVIDLEDKKPKSKPEDKDKEDDEEDKETEEDEEEDEDELKELEEELEEPDLEKLELVVPNPRREILKKYPQLFKDFPYLEKAYYREQQYTEIFPTLEDAKEAVSKAEVLDQFDKDLSEGNIEKVLLAAKESGGFEKVADNYLEVLSKVDKEAFHHVIGNTAKSIIAQMFREGKRTGNEALESASVILNQFIFGTSDYTPPTKLAKDGDKKNSTEDEKLKSDREEFEKRKFEDARNNLNTRVNNSIRSTIEAHIDPKQSMTDYVRRNASREALESLEKLISQDPRFKVIVNKLWTNAAKKDYDKNSVDMIRSAFLSKAKTLLPSVIKKARNEALKGMGKRTANAESEEETPTTKSDRTPSRSHNKSDKSKIPEGMSSLDFLMADD